jgi:ferredoxin
VRICVDMDLCQGHGVCCEEAPALFALDGDRVRVLDESPPEDQREALRRAVKYCPTRAISIEEE